MASSFCRKPRLPDEAYQKCSGTAAGLPSLAPHPVPDLLCALCVREDDQMLERGLGDLMLDLLARGAVRDLLSSGRLADPSHHPALLGDSLQAQSVRSANCDRQVRRCADPSPVPR